MITNTICFEKEISLPHTSSPMANPVPLIISQVSQGHRAHIEWDKIERHLFVRENGRLSLRGADLLALTCYYPIDHYDKILVKFRGSETSKTFPAHILAHMIIDVDDDCITISDFKDERRFVIIEYIQSICFD